jgi:8-oxo-dGTP diphosphatase
MSQPLGTCIIVVNKDQSKVLLGKRKNAVRSRMWGMPGGKVEVGEKLKEAAIREVEEETGIGVVTIDFVTTVKKPISKH